MKFTLGKIILLVGAIAFLLILSSALRMTHPTQPRTVEVYVPPAPKFQTVQAPQTPQAPQITTVTVVADAPIPPPTLPQEIWAQGAKSSDLVQATRKLLTQAELTELKAVCSRCLMSSLLKAVKMQDAGRMAYVQTGDINSMWLRDSSVQLAIYFPYITKMPSLRLVLAGAIRKLAHGILHDPYANSYSQEWIDPGQLDKRWRMIGRGGWTGTRNFELDSGAYFISLLWNYFAAPGLYNSAELVKEALVFDAVFAMVKTWVTEQNHARDSTYAYPELSNEGHGPPVAYTGLIWTGFRPSDDKCQYHYLIPANMFAVGALTRALALNEAVWKHDGFKAMASKLKQDVLDGINKHGIVDRDGQKVYAYEVDGRGGVLADFDDANVPSLLATPLLGFDYDKTVYENTRARILSPKNPYYFTGKVEGIGSPHTPGSNVWPMAMVMDALTTDRAERRVELARMLLKSQCGNGVMHESINVDSLSCTRMWFEWANALFVVFHRHILGEDCEAEAQQLQINSVLQTEKSGSIPGAVPVNAEDIRFYQPFAARIHQVRDEQPQVGWFTT